MEFTDRNEELAELKSILAQSKSHACFTVVTGRRRIGKTALLLHAYNAERVLYFFVARKAERELCEDFVDEIRAKLGEQTLGKPERFAEIFSFLMQYAKKEPLILVIDEFQEFSRVNKGIFSEIQRIWDLNKGESKINLLVCGSVHSLMSRIFVDRKEPLYARQTRTLRIHPFAPSVLKGIMQEYAPASTRDDLLALYLFTGGVPKYVEMFVDGDALTRQKMLNRIVSRDSFFLEEGKNMLIEEFGKDYGTYFSILSLIARGHNTRGDIEGILKLEIGGYLSRLLDEYGILGKRQPLFERSANKRVRYAIRDCFLRFWFRFMFKYNYMLEIAAYEKLQQIIRRDYETYSGTVLEDYFRLKLVESGRYTRLGYWHDRKGENEIDIIAADELGKAVDFFEVKRQASDVDLNLLQRKAEVFLATTKQYSDFRVSCRGLSLEDM